MAVLWFEIINEGNAGKVFPIRNENDFVRVGRCSTCTVFLHSPNVAKHHALFIVRDGRYLYCCRVNRGYLTLLNGRHVLPPFGVMDGDCLQVGEFVLRFHAQDGANLNQAAGADRH
jgi:pSer/pThr/pTyr-binding forkhead associated (FHA) protein